MPIRTSRAMSLDTARGLLPRQDAILISILGKSESASRQRPELTGWRAVLILEFEDASETVQLAKPGDWPLEPTLEQNTALLGIEKGRIPALSDARKIVDFLSKHHALDESLDLLVHCQAGVSRSVMVAYKTALWLDLAMDPYFSTRLAYANERLGRLMEIAQVESDLVGRLESAGLNP